MNLLAILLSKSFSELTSKELTIFYLIFASIVFIISGSIMTNFYRKKRKRLKNTFDSFATNKFKFAFLNLLLGIFITFTGVIGFILTTSIFIGIMIK